MARKPDPTTDWERAERHYRVGVMSLREIAQDVGVSEAAIRKQAAKEGWTRDLNEKIRAKVEELVRKDEARKVLLGAEKLTEQQIVDTNAQAASVIVIAQKASIKRQHDLYNKLMAEVEAITDNKELFERLGELMDQSCEDDDCKVRQDKLNEIYKKAISLPTRVDSTKKMVEILEKIVKMEREAFGIDEKSAESPVDAAIKRFDQFRAAASGTNDAD